MASRYIRIDRSSRQLLRLTDPSANYRLPSVGPYVTTVSGRLCALRDTVVQEGTYRSKVWSHGERDRDPGTPDSEASR